MKNTYPLLFVIVILVASCKKYEQNTCLLDVCDARRFTKVTADNTNGTMVYNNVNNKWGIVSLVVGTSGGKRTSYICGPLNDSFKIADKKVIFSGNLKEGCDARGEIFYIQPSMIR